MKNYFFILFVFATFSSFAQTDFSSIKMESDSDYKAAEKYALEASNYVLSSPSDVKSEQWNNAVKFILKWETGTPDYTFIIEAPITTSLAQDNKNLVGVYLASMAKFRLENPAKEDDAPYNMVNALKMLIAYAEKPENKVAKSDTIKQLIEAGKKGELEKYTK